ncbi:MAG: double zinc ribbon domain-containing protein, partial [Clostridiales bacterium]|nr:double zinc ribbon domain-containing protein [Clostridiales bacterium]
MKTSISEYFLDLLFPPKCAFCKEIIPNAEGKKVLICRRCKGGFNYFPKDSV